MENEIDVLEMVKIRNARPIWDAKDERIVRWRLATGPNDAEPDKSGEVYEVTPETLRMPLESLVLLRSNDPMLNPIWVPIVATSHFYRPIPHQLVLSYFLDVIKARYPDSPLIRRTHIDSPTRMIKLFGVDETVEIEGDELSFYMSITNSYDLSLGIHTDGYIHNEAQDWGLFLGLAGKWEGTFKHYWDAPKLKLKMSERIVKILQKKEARIATIKAFAGTKITPDTITKVGRALNCQKKEKNTWDASIPTIVPEGVEINTVWVKNAGFTCVSMNDSMTAWQMTGLFAKWASNLSDRRKTDISQRLFFVIEKILKEERAEAIAKAPRIEEIPLE
jgi:hypothetical protein